MGRLVTYSRSTTLVPTRTCSNRCAYCGFRRVGDGVLSWPEVDALLEGGVRQGCRELLIMSGERPWLEPGFPLGEEEYVEYLYLVALQALRRGLLPHTNVGLLTYDQLRRLKEVNVSMGLMLETINDDLRAHPGSRRKRAQERLEHIEMAGALRIPFTTGILVGIGETADDRRASLEAIAALHRRHGHIQELIVQNYCPKPGTPMSAWPEPKREALLETVRLTREILPGVSLQVPPNLNPAFEDLLQAGADDLGGIGCEPDQINPDDPWPSVEELRERVSSIGFRVLERLPVYPEVEADLRPAADALRRELVGDAVTYVVNCNVNFTNVCAGRCGFCAFRRNASASDAFLLSTPEILDKIEIAVGLGATEVCMQGGLRAELGLEFYLALLRQIKARYPALHVHAFSPMEIHWMSRGSGRAMADVLAALKAEGLDSIPGTAAEILVDEVRRVICPTKLTTAEWAQVIRTAHRLGIPTTATIMFGHVETWEHRIRHLEVIRDIQRDTGGFTELVLLPFIPGDTPLARRHGLRPITVEETLKLTAYARLYLGRDLVNIQNSWVKMGVADALRSLEWGANDFGGTLMEENISRSAGAPHGQCLSADQIRAAIASVGRLPVQRDTLYNR